MKKKEETTNNNYTPEYHAQLCVVCNGHKTVGYSKLPCEVCNQLGYLKIPIKETSDKEVVQTKN